MSSPLMLVAAFPSLEAAMAAEQHLRAAGIDSSAMTLAGAGAAPDPTAPKREAGFIGRLVLIVVFWSIVGAIIGAVIGVALGAAGVPPGGTFGILVQIIVWALFGHLMAGMWAGYALLTTGESRQSVTRTRGGQVLLSVRSDDDNAERVHGLLQAAAPRTVAAYTAEGKLVRGKA